MPITITKKSLAPLCLDYEFTVNDFNMLVELVTQLCLGQYQHVSNVIRALSPSTPNPDVKAMKSLRDMLDTTGKSDQYVYQIHGWLFQMVSWVALAIQHNGDIFYQHCPQLQPAMSGIDGIAITLKADGSIDRIIISEDKCTKSPRSIIQSQVWPEFDDYERGGKNSIIFQQIQSLFLNDSRWHKIQSDVTKEDYRQYRIAITRKDYHNSDAGRRALFKDYNNHVTGTDVERRTGATICIVDMRKWMDRGRKRVIRSLDKKIKKLCSTP